MTEGHANIYVDKFFRAYESFDHNSVGFDVQGDFPEGYASSLLTAETARALAADLLAVADRVDPPAHTQADKGKGSFVAFVLTDELTGQEHLTEAVTCEGGVLRGRVVTSFEEALDAAENLVRGTDCERVDVVELTAHRRGLVRMNIERSVA